jgi:Ca2+-binding RTX toxin-like protein
LIVLSIQNLVGSNNDDTLVGDGGANMLTGGLGNDTLIGGNDNDMLIGGQGDDTLTGGADADTFFFQLYADTGAPNIGNDVIADFQAGIDTLQLASLSTGQAVHVAQDHDKSVITIDHVVGSITLLGTQAADVVWTH